MKIQQQSARKSRVRQLIQAGGLLQKSSLLEAFHIHPGDDLQEYNNRAKAATLLGFLIECFEKNDFDQENWEKWKNRGERLLCSSN